MASDHSPVADRTTGIVTFLFTDIEGSTGRWEAQTAEMGAALAGHDDALRGCSRCRRVWVSIFCETPCTPRRNSPNRWRSLRQHPHNDGRPALADE